MAVRSSVNMQLHSRNNRDLAATPGTLNMVIWDSKERLRNALKTFGTFIGLTCCAVFLPIIHYFLVPTLFVTTFVMTMDKYGQIKFFEGGQGKCPKCGGEMSIQKSKYKERLIDTCSHCGEDVEVLIVQN